jgi:uncharacterized membrane protein YphA (DoxX/SURF4 family)
LTLRFADEVMALLRIGVGLYFAKAIVTRLTVHVVGGVIPLPAVTSRWIHVMPLIVAHQAAGNPVGWYRTFLLHVVLPHAALFAHLTAWGEVVTGVLVTLGFLTPVGALLGAWLVVNYGLATQWISPAERTMHLLLLGLLLAFAVTGAGRRWGLDGVRSRRRQQGSTS